MWSRVVALVSRLRFAVARRRIDRETRSEFESHLELLADRYVRLGMTPDEARRAARCQFGNVTIVREELHQMSSIGWLEEMLTDLRYGLRLLRRNRGFALVAILTLALGVGANAAVFSVVNATLAQPLPFPDPERLVAVFETARRTSIERRAVSYLNFRDWQREARSFEAMAAVLGSRLTLETGETPERLNAELVPASYFDVLGVRPARGRGLTPQDDSPGAAPVVVISDALWQRAFAGDPEIVGRRITVNGELSLVVGVMGPGFGGIVDNPARWAPIARFAGEEIVTDRGQRSIDLVVARLAPGVAIEQARMEMDALAARIDTLHPSSVGERGAGIASLRSEFVGGMQPMLLVLLGAVGFVLAIACVNVSNLMLARGAARQGELAVRRSLGAHDGRIVRQLLAESVVLFVLGGIAGLLAAFWGLDLLVAMSPVPFPDFLRIEVNLRVFAVTLGACLAGGLLSGIAPAIAARRALSLAALKTTGRDGDQATTLRRGLVSAEITLAVVLLVGAGLMLRTIDRLTAFDPGFQPRGLVTLRLMVPEAPGSGEAAPERLAAFSRTLLEQLRGLPGVSAVSLSSDVPLGTSTSATNVRIDGNDQRVRVYRHAVSPGHFRTIGAPLVAGRDFTDADGRRTDRVVIVSRAMANRYWPGGEALHQRVWRDDQPLEIVGIVGNLKHRRLLEPDSADPDIYIPFYQAPSNTFAVLARTAAGEQSAAVTALRQTISTLAPAVPVFQIEVGEQLLRRQTSRPRFVGALLAAFALVALTLTMVGIYGVTAEIVSRQTRQVGIRMALGATPADVLRLVLSGGMTFIATGLVLGTIAALGLTRLLGSWIYGVSATDPVTFAAVIVVLALVALLACLIPAVKATRIDPLVALRTE